MKAFALSLTLCCALASPAFTQQAADSTLIDVTLQGLTAGKVRLVGSFGSDNYLVDSTDADVSGHFVLRRQKPLAPGYYTFLLPGMKNFAVLVDRDQHFSIKADLADLVNTIRVDGSLNTDLFYRSIRLQAKQEPELNQLVEIMRSTPASAPEHQQAKERQKQLLAERKSQLETMYKEHPDAFFTKFKIAGQNPDLVELRKPNGHIDTMGQLMHYRAHFWDGVDFKDERLLHTPVIGNKLRRYIKELTPQHPDSLIKVADELVRRVLPYKTYFQFFVNWIGLQYENGKTNVMDGEAVYVHLINTFITPENAFWTTKDEVEKLRKKTWEMQASLLGRKGPDVQAKNPAGELKSIYEIKAPLIVIFMFSPDCEHCQKEAPQIQQIYQRYKDRGVEVFAIGVQTTETEWKEFVKKNGFTFTNVFDPTNRAIYAKYYVDITPEIYVLNRDRTIVAKNLTAEQLETVLDRELKKVR